MVTFTTETRPSCEKCKELPAITKMENDLWVCGECLHKYIQKLKEKNREAFLTG